MLLNIDITVAQVLGVGTAALIVSLICEVIIRALAWDSATQGRFGPLLAVGVGILAVGGAALSLHGDIAQAVLTGLLAGATAMNLHDLGSGTQTRLTAALATTLAALH